MFSHISFSLSLPLSLSLSLSPFQIRSVMWVGCTGTLVEDVQLVSEYVHPTTNRKSLCFRINYRSMERNLTNAEIDDLQFKLRSLIEKRLGVQLR
jgi:phenylalanyl-tRNA synthetase beta subunit